MGEQECQELEAKLKASVGVNGKPIINNSSYDTLIHNFCKGTSGNKVPCQSLFNALELVLNPNDESSSNRSAGFASALLDVCNKKDKIEEQSWIDMFSELIAVGIDATSSAWKEQNLAQQSEASNVAIWLCSNLLLV